MSSDSTVRRFLLENLDIRGAVVRLGEVWQQLQRGREYDAATRSLMGQMAAVTAVISGNLKQAGRLTFQLQGHGPVRLMVVDCDATLNIRGYARTESAPDSASPAVLFGDGHLMLTLEIDGMDQPYQSFVPIEGDTLAELFSHYLRRSEQQETLLLLAADQHAAGCLFLQKLPDADLKDPDGWDRVRQLAATVKDPELLGLDCEALLFRLFHDEVVRVFDPRPVRHDWPANREKAADMLRSLGREELERIIHEDGGALIRDDLSNHAYRFDADELRALIDNPPTLQ
ncbi:MAG: Hsp33 family molecular chaperone HslO [Rhodocyclaceae bacterium]|nr:Hsp33 family molecular chaperone HslO [Rhodocyclaceae bacterium]